MVSPQPAAEPRATVVATPSRLLRATALVMALFLAGAGGYRLVEGVPWWDAFYMTVITITTVGFGHVFPLSPAGEALTVALLGAGIGVFLFLASEVGRSIMEGELRRYLGHVRRVRMIERMSGHDIVCGYGRMGRAAVDALRGAGRQVVVIEARVEQTGELAAAGRPVVTGDATREASLRAANVEHARGLVCCLADDAHNLYTVLTARSLNPEPRHRGPGRRRGRRAADSAGRRRPGGESLSARGGASRPSASSNQPALRALLRARRRRPATLPGRPAARPPCPRPCPTAPR